jgi:hypothetical protein
MHRTANGILLAKHALHDIQVISHIVETMLQQRGGTVYD